MIRLRIDPPLFVQAHMIVAIGLSFEGKEPELDVHSPDGSYWGLTAKDIGAPINAATITSLAAEIDKQCREIGAAGVVSDQVKRMIENRFDEPAKLAKHPFDDEIPF